MEVKGPVEEVFANTEFGVRRFMNFGCEGGVEFGGVSDVVGAMWGQTMRIAVMTGHFLVGGSGRQVVRR
jgi:hypothetical protein